MSKKNSGFTKAIALVTTCTMVFTAFPTQLFANDSSAISYDNVTDTSVEIYGSTYLNVGTEITSSEVMIWSDSGLGSSKSVGEDFDVTFTGLAPNTTYHAQAVASYAETIPVLPPAPIDGIDPIDLEGYGENGEYLDDSEFGGTGNIVSGTIESNVITFTTTGNAKPASNANVGNASVSNVKETSATFSASFNADGYEVYNYGFVYSNSNSSPTLQNSDSTMEGSSKTSGDFSANINDLQKGSTYYVRPYVETSNSVVYASSTTTFTSENNGKSPSVTTEDVTYENGNIKAYGKVTDNRGNNIKSQGFVYSSSNANPTTSDNKYEVNTKDSSFSGNYSVSTNSEYYYVRAYATTENGTGYGDSKKVSTKGQKAAVSLSSITNITSTSADINIDVTNKGASDISARGVVYSKDVSNPEMNGSSVLSKSIDGSTGKGTANISGLTANTKYYVRAYAKNGDGYSYSNATNFITSPATVSNVNIIVSYKTPDKKEVGTQTISLPPNSTLKMSNLSAPTGYSFTDPNWTYSVAGATTVSVPVKQINTGAKPTPPPAVVNTSEKAFMPGTGGNTFSPEAAATRAQVAEVIYNLSDTKTMGGTPMAFSDLNATSSYKTAIDYCTSNGLMSGYPDGTFKPDATITRAEISVVLCTVYGLSGQGQKMFSDTKDHWAKNFIALAADNGMINGFTDGSFGPDQSATRAQVCTLFSLAENRTMKPLGNAMFSDVPADYWAYKYIMNASVPN